MKDKAPGSTIVSASLTCQKFIKIDETDKKFDMNFHDDDDDDESFLCNKQTNKKEANLKKLDAVCLQH